VHSAPRLRPSNGLRSFKRKTRGLIARGVGRYGYELVRSSAGKSSSATNSDDFDQIPRGRQEPFATAEYDVLPIGKFDVVARNYYSPIPDLAQLPENIWERRSTLGGVELDPEAGIDFIESQLGSFIAELDIQIADPHEPGVFFLCNSGFESVDAELLYGMIRSTRPARIIELGSGYTTLLINCAARRNAEEGAPASHVAYDPYPREYVLGSSVAGPSRLEAISATDVPLEVFEELEAGDVLFVDTTHTVKLASDVNFIVLDVLPRLRPGVLVHFHDVFLPWEYPRVWFEKLRYYWAEQYLLQAFLAFNSDFSILVPAHAVAREHPARLGRVIPSFRAGVSPGSLWLERREPSAQAKPRDDLPAR
jgi:Methyltransferase domain